MTFEEEVRQRLACAEAEIKKLSQKVAKQAHVMTRLQIENATPRERVGLRSDDDDSINSADEEDEEEQLIPSASVPD